MRQTLILAALLLTACTPAVTAQQPPPPTPAPTCPLPTLCPACPPPAAPTADRISDAAALTRAPDGTPLLLAARTGTGLLLIPIAPTAQVRYVAAGQFPHSTGALGFTLAGAMPFSALPDGWALEARAGEVWQAVELP